MADTSMTFEFEGKSYALEDFPLGDLEWLEEELGPLPDADFTSFKAMTRVVTIIKRQSEPDFTLEEARKLKLSVFSTMQSEERPTKARSKRAAAGGRK